MLEIHDAIDSILLPSWGLTIRITNNAFKSDFVQKSDLASKKYYK